MREIKFRFWDGKSMTQNYTLEKLMAEAGNVRFDLGDEIMQYTGLKDKNGKEIFEGDVLQLAKGDDGAIYACVVTFNNETGAFACRKIDEDKPYSDHMYGSHIGEVIGNIYENPELIK